MAPVTMLETITPLILTFNEAPNIARTLDRLKWANDIVVVDSLSTDETMAILARYPNVRVFQRAFETHAAQWNFGLAETGIATQWVLALDADYFLTDELSEEIRGLAPQDGVGGYMARFRYCINGKPLRGAAYPPVTVLFRKAEAGYLQDGHTQRIEIKGSTEMLRARIFHDDRKSLRHWIASQERYMRLEAEKLRNGDPGKLGLADRIRRLRIVAPFAMLFFCLIVRGAILDGRAGIFYALQRTFAELLLSLYLLEGDFQHGR